MGGLLAAALRQTDAGFRTGGDEFALILPETSELEVTAVSFGVAVYPRDGDDPESLFRAADEAMYTAKRSGRRTHFAA